MSPLTIDIEQIQTAFLPGQVISGTASWNLDKPPKQACLRLLWYTQGRGTEDVGILESVEFDMPRPTDNRSFEFRLPAGPYSFSGTLISLIWAVEVEVAGECERVDFVVSPTGEEITLNRRLS